ncbi:hypothetical protein AGMMS49965_04460 [Bacteroidia bacterium]|nr:hypothetical protein AGMMS49965_04460 [Bacteroidia bacterium]
MLKINDLRKSYGKKEVLSGISLELLPGQIYGLVGENGSGKTTLFECIRHLQAYQGTVTMDTPAAIGYLPTALYFYPLMRGTEYIEFCLSARKLKINAAEIQSLNHLFELPLNDYAAEYSTGMKKKLAFMALLMQKNDILLLDEPFNGLDLSSCLILKQILLQLKAKNKTILLSSHILSSLTDICDTIVYLHHGKIQKTYSKDTFDIIEQEIMDGNIGEKLKAVVPLCV